MEDRSQPARGLEQHRGCQEPGDRFLVPTEAEWLECRRERQLKPEWPST